MADPLALGDFTPILQNVYLPIRKKIFPMNTVLAAQARKLGPDQRLLGGAVHLVDPIDGGGFDRRGPTVSGRRPISRTTFTGHAHDAFPQGFADNINSVATTGSKQLWGIKKP